MDKQKRKGYNNYGKGFYQKRARQFTLETGMTGFLCTCNFREKECIRDAYKLLEEFANELYGCDNNSTKIDKSTVEKKDEHTEIIEKEQNDDDDEDISVALDKEIAALKAESKKPPATKRFQNADVGAKNVIFISTTLPNPLELALSIIKKLDETKQQRTRFLLRLLPIQVVCKANMPDIKAKADRLFDKYFAEEPKTFSIVFNRHSNHDVQRNVIIDELADLVMQKNPGNKVDLKKPELAVIVEVIRSFCLLSIAPDYFKYKKYNLLELCNIKEAEKPSKEGDEEATSDCDNKEEKSDAPSCDLKEAEKPSKDEGAEAASDCDNEEKSDAPEDKEAEAETVSPKIADGPTAPEASEPAKA